MLLWLIHFSFLNEYFQWNVDFVRNVNNWEVNKVFSFFFFGRLYDVKIAHGREYI